MDSELKVLTIRKKVMDFVYGFLCITFLLSIFPAIVCGGPKLFRYIDLNWSEHYLENRAEKKVKDLKEKIRVIELEKEAVGLEKKLSDISKKE